MAMRIVNKFSFLEPWVSRQAINEMVEILTTIHINQNPK